MNEDEVSVVIVTYNAERYINAVLRSVLRSRGVEIREIIVVDNASKDRTREIVKKYGEEHPVVLIGLAKNYGFPLAVNIGVERASGEYVVILNPDVIVDPDCFAKMLHAIRSQRDVVVVQPKILHPGGFIDSAGGLMDFLGHGFHIGKYEKDQGQYNSPREIMYGSFSCVLVRKHAYLSLGGMDPRYFLYNEDLDLCWRAWLAGHRVVYEPRALAYHVGQHATRKMPYHTAYFSRRNRLFMVYTNYPLLVAIFASFLLLALYTVLGVVLFFRDRYESRLIIRIYHSFISNAKNLAHRRILVKRKRGILFFYKRGLMTLRLVGIVFLISRLLAIPGRQKNS